MRAVLLAGLLAGLVAAGCSDLDGLASSPAAAGDAGTGLFLRTQVTVSRTDAPSSVELTAPAAEEGDLLYYLLVVAGNATVTPPAEVEELVSLDEGCVPAKLRVYTRVAASSVPATQSFALGGAASSVDATLLVLGGVDPAVRANAMTIAAGTTFRPGTLTPGAADVPGHVVLTYVAAPNPTAPAGTTLLARNGRTTFFTSPIADATPYDPPAITFADHQCGFVGATLFKDR